MKKILKGLMVIVTLMFFSGIVYAADEDYTFADCLMDNEITVSSSPIDMLQAFAVCREYIDTDDAIDQIKSISDRIKYVITILETITDDDNSDDDSSDDDSSNDDSSTGDNDEENILDKLIVFRECRDEGGRIKACLLEAGIEIDGIDDLVDQIKAAIAGKVDETKTCIADIDFISLDKEERKAAIQECLSILKGEDE